MHIIVTAGPTREYIDPVRFLSNPSTGKMGFAVAAEAARRGHDVTLISGPVALKTPKGVRRVDVVSAREMLERSLECLGGLGKGPGFLTWRSGERGEGLGGLGTGEGFLPWRSGERGEGSERVAFIATAAVADWRPAKCAAQKLKKREMSSTLKLVRNPDILKAVRGCRKVGFAAETDDVLESAWAKCRRKRLSFIVANDVTEPGSGFGVATNRVTFVFPDGSRRPLPLMSKRRVASAILDEIEK